MKPLAFLVCAGLLAAACGGDTAAPPAQDAAAPQRKAPETFEVKSARVPRTLSYVGTVVSSRDALVASPRGGRVDAYFFEVGQPVKHNDVLVKLAAAELDFASQAAAASVKSARARIGAAKDPENMPSALIAKGNFALAEDSRRRAEKLHAQGSMSEQELSRARSNESTAKAEYEAALAQAAAEFARLSELEATSFQARTALGDQAVKAPFDGVVLERFVDVGQMAGPNAALVRVFDPSERRVRFHVPQFDAYKVSMGSQVSVLADGRKLRGKVVRTTPGLVGDANTRLVEATLDVPEAERNVTFGQLLPGARLMLWLEIEGEDEVIELPRSATTASAGLVRAWVVEGDRLRERLLSVLRVQGDQLLISGGLKAGDKVVRDPLPDFRSGEELAK
jgi:membrane fusion protein, multidrug efflux system